VIVGGDFNVDFARNRLHTAMLNSFCEDVDLTPVSSHNKYSIDYSYNFNMCRFNTLDHFLLSEIIFNTSVESAHVLHDVDNISDHEPIILQLHLQMKYLGFISRIYTPRVSWAKAIDSDIYNYQCTLSQRLRTDRSTVMH
jgi:hypothetical protein